MEKIEHPFGTKFLAKYGVPVPTILEEISSIYRNLVLEKNTVSKWHSLFKSKANTGKK